MIVGVGGINFYAGSPAEAIATVDLDALVAPTTSDLSVALRVLARLGYEFEAEANPS